MKLQDSLLMAAFSLIAIIMAASGANIPIKTLPLNITLPGTYVLEGNMSYPATNNTSAITIANNITGSVLVDLKGFTIAGAAESPTGASFGVTIGNYDTPMTNRYPIIVKNGTLTNFTIGINSSQGGHAGLTNLTFSNLTITHPIGAGVQTTAIYLTATF